MSTRTATATWRGGLKDGNGKTSGASGAFQDLAYDFRTRFEDQPGTNPEELIAAAHAACFSMATSGELGKAKLAPESIEVRATLTLEMTERGPTVTMIHLDARGTVPGASEEAFRQAAETAKANCPISRLLNCTITLDARLA